MNINADHPNDILLSLGTTNHSNDTGVDNPSNISRNSTPTVSHLSFSVSQQQPVSHANSPDRKPKKSSLTCTTCRARKVRCNGARNICSNCERLGFPCSYDDGDSNAWSGALPRRRVRQACLSCHSRKARCSGHVPSCERCRVQGIECVYRPSKRARTSLRADGRSPQSHDGDKEDGHIDSDANLTDPAGTGTPTTYNHDHSLPDESFDAVIGRSFEKFFRHIHHIPMYSFLHRASLMERYHAGKVEKSLLLALVGITSCLTDMGPGMREYGNRCIDDAEGLIFADYHRPSTIKVQALVFIIKHRILSKKFPNAFTLLSLASRYAAALRLNHESPNLCFLAQESRRRLIWSLYCIDTGVSGGYRDFALWNADNIHVSLPCNERNFEFDLPQLTEKLVHNPDEPRPQQVEDIGSLALHIRIQHMRRRIMEFSKRVICRREVKADELQGGICALHKELDDFAAHLPTSFQFSESSLRLRAYSPRICAFIMIHVWWHQCFIDLYRHALVGFREALPRSVLETMDENFLDHCRRQCIEHSMSMANIFASMQKLNTKPVTDLDLAICAYQCARMLTYAYHNNIGPANLSAEAVLNHGKICLQVIKECCMGTTAAAIKADFEELVSKCTSPLTSPAVTENSEADPGNRMSVESHFSRQNMPLADEQAMTDAAHFGSTTTTSMNQNAFANVADSSFPPSLAADPWVPESQLIPDMVHSMFASQGGAEKLGEQQLSSMTTTTPRPEFTNSNSNALNNAYDGGLDGLGLDSGMDYGFGIEQNLWIPNNGDWLGVDTLNGGVGA